MSKIIAVVGYPRSGNTWLSRILGECLNSPVRGFDGRHPLAEEGSTRGGEYVIAQEHLRVEDHPEAKVVFLLRDPRDVAVSIQYYWQMNTLDDAIQVMGEGRRPLRRHGPWSQYTLSWMHSDRPVIKIKYEKLLEDTLGTMRAVCDALGVQPVDLESVVEHQSFENKRKDVLKNGDQMTWGRTVQLRHMRKGVAGDWRNCFEERHVRMASSYFGKAMSEYGYE